MKKFILLLVLVMLVGCVPINHYNSPRYSTNAFSSKTVAHRYCAYNGNEYFFYDSTGKEGNGIYRANDKNEIKKLVTISENATVSNLSANSNFLYYINNDFCQVDLYAGTTKIIGKNSEFISYLNVFTDYKNVFVEAIIHGEEDFGFSLLMYSSENIDREPINLRSKFMSEEYCYKTFSDDDYTYIYLKNNIKNGIVAIFDKFLQKQIYADNNQLSLIDFSENEALFCKEKDIEHDVIVSIDFQGNEQELQSIEDGFKCISNNKFTQADETFLLAQKGKPQSPLGIYNLPQSLRDLDEIISINNSNGKYSSIYKTSDKKTRIIGFENNKVYLFNDFKIYCTDLTDGVEMIISTIPNNFKDLDFEICGAKMFVWVSNSGFLEFIEMITL